MGERIDQFCENLRIKLTSIDNNMNSLKAKIDGKARTAEQDVRTHLDGVKKRIEQERTKVSAAQADIKKWVEERKATTSDKIAEWKTKLDIFRGHELNSLVTIGTLAEEGAMARKKKTIYRSR